MSLSSPPLTSERSLGTPGGVPRPTHLLIMRLHDNDINSPTQRRGVDTAVVIVRSGEVLHCRLVVCLHATDLPLPSVFLVS